MNHWWGRAWFRWWDSDFVEQWGFPILCLVGIVLDLTLARWMGWWR